MDIKERMDGIGGSDAAAACGAEKAFRCRGSLWMEKVGITKEELPDNSYMRAGRLLEDGIFNMYLVEYILGFPKDEEASLKAIWERHNKPPKMYSDLYPWMTANIDRELIDNDGNRCVVEIKNVNLAKSKEWFVNDDGEPDVPEQYLYQLYHYMIVGNYDYGVLVALFGGNTLKTYRFDRNPEFEAMIIEKEREFWSYVVNRKEPPADWFTLFAAEAKHDVIVKEDSKPAELQVEGNPFNRLAEIKTALKLLEAEKDKLESELVLSLGDSEVGIVFPANESGIIRVVTRLEQGTAKYDIERLISEHPDKVQEYMTALDWKRFKERYPELAKQYQGKARVLRIKEAKDEKALQKILNATNKQIEQ